MAQEVRIEGKADFSQPEREFARLNKRIEELEKLVEKLSKKKIKVDADPAAQELKKLRSELNRIDGRFIRATESVKRYQTELASSKRGTEEFSRAQRGLRRALKSVTDTGEQFERVLKKLPPELRKSARRLDDVRVRADQARASLKRLGDTRKAVSSLVSTIGQLRTGIGALVAALGIQQIIRFGRALIKIGADAVETKQKFDALIPGLTAFVGSLQVAEEVADQLAATSERLKTPLADLIQPFLRISAATKETNLSLTEQSELFQSALLTARAFGLGTEEVSRLITGFAQVAGKGSLQMEELRQQIGEVAFNALPALAKALGTTVPQLIDDVASGAIDAETALRGLAEGLTAANEAAGLAQLDTLKGDLGDFQRVSENAQRALVDGLEPGLRLVIVAFTDFLEGNQEVIRELGKLVSEGFEALVATFGNVRSGLVDLGKNLQEVAERFKVLSAVPGFEKLGEALDSVGVALSGVRAEAVKTFAEFEKASKRQATGAQETALEIQEAFTNAFREQAKAAGSSAEDIKAIEEDLKVSLGKIADASIDERRELEEKFIADFEEFGGVRVETVKNAADQILAIDTKNVESRAALLGQLLTQVKASTEARVRAETEAAEEVKALVGGIVAAAKKTAAQRVQATQGTVDKIVELESAAAEKIAELASAASEALLKSGADREAIAEELSDKIVAIEEKLASDTIREQERIAAAAKVVADKRIAEEARIRKAYDQSIAKIKELADSIAEIAKGDQEGSAIGELAGDAKELAENLEDAAKSFGTLFGDLAIGTDPGAFLEDGFKDAESLLGGAADGVGGYVEQLDQAQESTTELKDFTEQLKDAIANVKEEISSFGAQTQENLNLLIGNFEALAEQGPISQEAFAEFGATLGEQLANAGTVAEEAAGQVGMIASQAEGLGAVGEAATLMGEELKGAGDAAIEAEESVITFADGTQKVIPAFGAVGDAAKQSAEELDSFKEAGEGAVEPLEKIGDAAEKLRQPIIGEGEGEKLTLLGTAAGEAQEPMTLLAEPVEKIALGAQELSVSLPIVTDSLVKLKPELEAIKTLLTEDPIDLDAIGTALAAIATPLDLIGVALASLKNSLIEIPEPLEKLREPARELVELVAKTAEDGSFTQLGVALEVIAKALPEIPEPLDKFREALKQITDLQDEIEGTFKAVAEGLAAVTNEEVLTSLGTLGENLEDVAEGLGKAGTRAGELKTAAEDLSPELDKTKTSTQELASAIQGQLLPALESAKTKSGEAKEAIGELEDVIDETKEALTELGAEADTVFQKIVSGANAAKEAVSELRKELAAVEQEAAAGPLGP